ncbi:MAG: GGDEF domain-containing protein, partial [Chloroflexi bacterium]|nr:GGDEF domain-containing protein [Chloroflexota bacterium]
HYEGTIEDITVRKQAEAELQYASTHDALTGLYNRIFFDTELRRMQDDRCAPVSIVMADVNGLKQVNDEYGHAEGDELLRRSAHVFRAAFRAVDIVARIGGDEFAVILPNMDEHAAEAVIDRARKCVLLENRQASNVPLRLALGVATNPGSRPLIDVLREADQRMYKDKSRQQET